MTSSPLSIPSLKALYWRDTIIQRSIKTAAFMAVVTFGFIWLAPSGPPPPGVDLSFEIAMAKWVPLAALAIAALALIFLARRYLWVKEVLTHGVPIKGTVEDLDVYAREASHSDNAPAFQRSYIRTYYAIIHYDWNGQPKKARIKLPGSPVVYQISKGKVIDLIALDSAPDQPLIRAVYQGRF